MKTLVIEENVKTEIIFQNEGGGGMAQGFYTANIHLLNGKFVDCQMTIPQGKMIGINPYENQWCLKDWEFVGAVAEFIKSRGWSDSKTRRLE